MVYDPANVAKSYLGGVAAGQQQQARGLDIEAMRKEMRSKEAQERKREKIGGLLGGLIGGDRASAGLLAGQGIEGVKALGIGTEYLRGQRQEQAAQATAEQKSAGEKLVKALPYAMNVTDEQEWRTQAFPYIADAFVQSGGDPELVRRLDKMPMGQAKQIMQQMFGDAKKQATKLDTYQNPKTGEVFTLDENNPEDVARIRKEGLIESPSRAIVTTDPTAFDLTKKQGEELKEAEIATKQAIATAGDILEKLKENPDLLSTAAGVAQFVSGLGSEVRSAARIAGVVIPESVSNIANYEEAFDALPVMNKVTRGLVFDLALSYAAASGLGTGRALTDKDVARALERVGAGGFNTPQARVAAIKDVSRILARNFGIRYETLTGKAYEGDMGLKGVKDYSKMTMKQLEGLDRKNMTRAELEEAAKAWRDLNSAK